MFAAAQPGQVQLSRPARRSITHCKRSPPEPARPQIWHVGSDWPLVDRSVDDLPLTDGWVGIGSAGVGSAGVGSAGVDSDWGDSASEGWGDQGSAWVGPAGRGSTGRDLTRDGSDAVASMIAGLDAGKPRRTCSSAAGPGGRSSLTPPLQPRATRYASSRATPVRLGHCARGRHRVA